MTNASAIISNEMTLEEKLAAIDEAMAVAQSTADNTAAANGSNAAPIDPQDFLMCESCQ